MSKHVSTAERRPTIRRTVHLCAGPGWRGVHGCTNLIPEGETHCRQCRRAVDFAQSQSQAPPVHDDGYDAFTTFARNQQVRQWEDVIFGRGRNDG